MKKNRIFVVMHKIVNLDKLNLDKCYERLLVGKKGAEEKILLDSTGDNISDKNYSYCELTGLYWIWKNVSAKVVGLCHYRRYFFKNGKILKEKEIDEILKEYDFILPKKNLLNISLYDQYNNKHIIEDIKLCKKIIEKKYPSYLDSFEKVMKSKEEYLFNMFICEKEIINNYCEWLFTILEQVEKETSINDRDDYQKRVFGFLSERLFNIWIDKNDYKICELEVKNIEDKKTKIIKNKLRQSIRKIMKKVKK